MLFMGCRKPQEVQFPFHSCYFVDAAVISGFRARGAHLGRLREFGEQVYIPYLAR